MSTALQFRFIEQTTPVRVAFIASTTPIQIRFTNEASSVAFITGNSNIRITTSGIWLYNSDTFKWNQLLNVGLEGYEQLGLGAAVSFPS